MKSRVIFPATALTMLIANPVFAAAPYNFFLSGKLFKDNEVVTTFATPILAGRTLPVRDLESAGLADAKNVRLELTPKASADKRVRVAVRASWSEGAPSVSVAGGLLNEEVDLAQGESKTVSFDCENTADHPPRCNYKLVLSASLQH